MDFFDKVEEIENFYIAGLYSEALAASFALGQSLREAMDRGEISQRQAMAIIDQIERKM